MHTLALQCQKMTFVFQAQMAKKMNDMGRNKVDMAINAGVDIALLCRFVFASYVHQFSTFPGRDIYIIRLLCNAKIKFFSRDQTTKKMNDMGREKVDMMISAGVDIALLCRLSCTIYAPSISWLAYESFP